MSNEHTNIINRTILEANQLTGTRLWSNPCGFGYTGTVVKRFRANNKQYITIENPRPVKFGLAPGSCDTIGFHCNSEGVPVFLGAEIKTPGDSLRPKQRNFISMIKNFGGFAGVVRKVGDIYNIIK